MLAVMMVCASVCIRLFGWLLGTYGWLGIACACAPVCIFGILCLFVLWHMNARDSYYEREKTRLYGKLPEKGRTAREMAETLVAAGFGGMADIDKLEVVMDELLVAIDKPAASSAAGTPTFNEVTQGVQNRNRNRSPSPSPRCLRKPGGVPAPAFTFGADTPAVQQPFTFSRHTQNWSPSPSPFPRGHGKAQRPEHVLRTSPCFDRTLPEALVAVGFESPKQVEELQVVLDDLVEDLNRRWDEVAPQLVELNSWFRERGGGSDFVEVQFGYAALPVVVKRFRSLHSWSRHQGNFVTQVESQ